LKDVPAARLGAVVIREALKRVGLRPRRDPEAIRRYAPRAIFQADPIELELQHMRWEESLREVEVDEVIMGNVLQGGQGQNPARQAMIYAGFPKEVTAFTVNKVCASGMKAVALAAQAILSGEAEVVVAGGMENMSAAPYYLPGARWGVRMFNAEMVDGMVHDGLWEIFYGYHMGVTAENIAERYGISREEQDRLALESNNRALRAIREGIFKEELVPVEVPVLKRGKQVGTQVVDTDEHPRETSMEALGKLPPVFKEGGHITAGNASAITDAAAALLVTSERRAEQLGLEPLAYIRSWASGGVDPAYMGLGAVPATRRALERAGLRLEDIEVVELNEAFAAQALGVMRELGLDLERTNPHGSGISLGHPIGCTGARILVTLAYEMRRRGARYGLATLSIGGGQGMAMVLERR